MRSHWAISSGKRRQSSMQAPGAPEVETESESPPRAAKRVRRVHCVSLPSTPLRFCDDDSSSTTDSERPLEHEHVARLVRRKQQAKRANAGRCHAKRSPAPDVELLRVFEFQPSAPETEEASSPLKRQRRDHDEELESCARHLQQLKWWIQQRVRVRGIMNA